jgi:hypothetical protein
MSSYIPVDFNVDLKLVLTKVNKRGKHIITPEDIEAIKKRFQLEAVETMQNLAVGFCSRESYAYDVQYNVEEVNNDTGID